MLVHLYRVAIKFTSINGPMILSTCSEGADPRWLVSVCGALAV